MSGYGLVWYAVSDFTQLHSNATFFYIIGASRVELLCVYHFHSSLSDPSYHLAYKFAATPSHPPHSSSHINRTVMSLQALLSGLFPQGTLLPIGLNLLADAEEEGKEGGAAPASDAEGSPELTVHVVPVEEEYMFPNTTPCARLAHVFREGELCESFDCVISAAVLIVVRSRLCLCTLCFVNLV